MPVTSRRRGRMLAGVVALFVPGCNNTPEAPLTACTEGQKGCVDLLNFHASAAAIGPAGKSNPSIPARSGTTAIAPGTGSTTVSSTVGSSTRFDAVVNGNTLSSVTCTVTPNAWAGGDVNPAVILQQTGDLSCSLW